MRTVAVVLPNLIGDTVMASPTFRALRAGFPSDRIVAVVKPGVSPVLDGAPWFDDRILFDPRSNDPERRWGAYFTLCWDGRHDPAAIAAIRRGMPNLALTEEQISQLVAYLNTLK